MGGITINVDDVKDAEVHQTKWCKCWGISSLFHGRSEFSASVSLARWCV